jgi:hypothetical protein
VSIIDVIGRPSFDSGAGVADHLRPTIPLAAEERAELGR